MKLMASLARTAVLGALSVALLSVVVSVISGLAPARPALYFVLLTLVLIPLPLLVIGALAARAAYFDCRGPNESIAASVAVALASALVGLAVWLLAVDALGLPDIVGPLLKTTEAGSYLEFAPLLLVYALAGSIGGVFDYFISQGRRCDIRPGEEKKQEQ
jgi:hypothetical protein